MFWNVAICRFFTEHQTASEKESNLKVESLLPKEFFLFRGDPFSEGKLNILK